MYEKGIIRKMDDLGRVVIPEEYRQAIGVEKGDAFWVTLQEDGSLRLCPDKHDSCLFCRGRLDLVTTVRGTICKHCLQDIFSHMDDGSRETRLSLR